MAERPDLDYARPRLAAALIGRVCGAVWVGDPVVLRLMLEGTPSHLLTGRTVQAVERKAHALRFTMEDVDLVIVPMLAGRLALVPSGEARSADTVLTLQFGAVELRLQDSVKMGKVYVCSAGDWERIPGLERLGLDVLDPEVFTLAAFRGVLRGRREQVRRFLMDKAAIDALGNAYADEVLFEARVHPKRRCNGLGDSEVEALHAAISAVLERAASELERREPALDVKLRDFLNVRNRKGEPCPRCGDAIRVAGVRGFDSFYCGTCQQDARPGWIDWSRARR